MLRGGIKADIGENADIPVEKRYRDWDGEIPRSGEEWYEYFEKKYGAGNVEWFVDNGNNGFYVGLPKVKEIYILESGGRNIYKLSAREVLALDEEAERIYDMIRSTSDDVVQISHQTGIPEWKIQKIKEHVFYNDHILDDRIGRFDADIDIADAWERLRKGNYNQNDLDLLNHEYYEHRFEKFFDTDYANAHAKTIESGRVWDPDKEID